MQSKKMSFVESWANVAIGFGINFFAQTVIFPCFGIYVPVRTNLAIGGIFTVISIVRSYTLRRLFNRQQARVVTLGYHRRSLPGQKPRA